MVTETRLLPCGAIVERYGIIGTATTVYRAYRPSSIMGKHSNITFMGGERGPAPVCGWYGDVATEAPPADIDAIPSRTAERYVAVHNWYAGRQEEAYRLIFAAYPGLQPGPRGWRQSGGSIEVYG